MNTIPDVGRARPGVDWRRDPTASRHPDAVLADAIAHPTHPAQHTRARRLARLAASWRYAIAVYALSRALYLLVAVVDSLVQHRGLGSELSNWDGLWYLTTTVHWYPHTIPHLQSTLGFLPLYPITMWLVGHALGAPYVVAGVIVSLITGGIATVLIARLAEEWFGRTAGRRAVLFFCLFPGSIVFSMVYTEGLTLALAAGSLLALERRRWLTAGVLAGLATAVDPVALAIIPACIAVAVREIRRHGWSDRQARRALIAPLLAPVGVISFGAFLWAWTGTPLASYTTQHADWGWQEHSSPLALFWTARKLVEEIFGPHTIKHPGINLNLIAGLAGAAFLIYALRLLWRVRAKIPLGALVWTFGIAVLTLTSDQTPPNARMLLVAFPAVLVVAAQTPKSRAGRLMAASTLLLVVMSFVTFVGTGLRP